MCTADTINQLVDSGSYVLICVTNAGVVDRGTMYGLARHLTELFSSAGEYRQWSCALLDYNAASKGAEASERLSAILPHARKNPVCVLRKGQRLATLSTVRSVSAVEEWLGSLRMGEVQWADLDIGD